MSCRQWLTFLSLQSRRQSFLELCWLRSLKALFPIEWDDTWNSEVGNKCQAHWLSMGVGFLLHAISSRFHGHLGYRKERDGLGPGSGFDTHFTDGREVGRQHGLCNFRFFISKML
jgi:hypothetical protein